MRVAPDDAPCCRFARWLRRVEQALTHARDAEARGGLQAATVRIASPANRIRGLTRKAFRFNTVITPAV